eukprot:661440-Rhodomonas_salina.1
MLGADLGNAATRTIRLADYPFILGTELLPPRALCEGYRPARLPWKAHAMCDADIGLHKAVVVGYKAVVVGHKAEVVGHKAE